MATAAKMKPSMDRELTVTRVIDAPRELVWKAWTDPKHLTRWWSERDFTNPVCDPDVRPDVGIRIDVSGRADAIYPIDVIFHEVTKPERLVFTSKACPGGRGVPGFEVRNTVILAEDGSKTRLTLKAVIIIVNRRRDEHPTEM